MIKLKIKTTSKSLENGNGYCIKYKDGGIDTDIALESMFAGCWLLENAKSMLVDNGLTEKDFKIELKNICKKIEEEDKNGKQ